MMPSESGPKASSREDKGTVPVGISQDCGTEDESDGGANEFSACIFFGLHFHTCTISLARELGQTQYTVTSRTLLQLF